MSFVEGGLTTPRTLKLLYLVETIWAPVFGNTNMGTPENPGPNNKAVSPDTQALGTVQRRASSYGVLLEEDI